MNNNNSPHDRVIAVVERIIKERPNRNCRAFRPGADRPIRSDDKLMEIGLVSLDLARLVLKIEDEFDLTIPARKLTSANFLSISTVSQLVCQLIETKS